jgi:hypothetical protein
MVRGEGPGDLAKLLGQLAVHMDEHLDFEDADILPLFERHMSKEDYDALEVEAQKSIGLGKQAAFTIPFVLYWLDAATVDHLMATAPSAFRVLHRLTRGRHAKMARTALGALAVPGSAVGRPAVPRSVAA